MSRVLEAENGEAESKVCNVCHLTYTGQECPFCKAEREHALAVIQERGRRHRQSEMGDDDCQ